MKQRRKLTLTALLLYWPTIFVLAHIPIPRFVYRAHVSDKAIHFVVYLILVFLLWFIVSPTKKVNWRKAAIWCVLVVMLAYAIADEVLQGYVGRNCDVADLIANMAAVLVGALLFTFASFWPAFLVVTAICIFILTNLAKVNPMELLPLTSLFFYLSAYALLTLLWIRHISSYFGLKPGQGKWTPIVLSMPVALLVSVESFSIIIGRGFRPWRLTASTAGIAVVVFTTILIASRPKSLANNPKRPV